ncbi:MAG TPA: CoA ester lyase, partial [Ramlibacter sp.]|nr:CoA ester lyase [Ramlibacter sp.]
LAAARQVVREFLHSRSDRARQQVWVRINALDSSKALEDLAAIVAGAPDGLLLPKCEGGEQIARLDHFLSALECREGVAAGSIRIMPVATETAAAMFGLGGYRNVSNRLHGLTWGAEDLATAVGASSNRDDNGAPGFSYQLARNLCLLGAKAAGVQALDTMNANFRDLDALERDVRRARIDGFTGKFAIHPDQVAVINAGFRPSDSEVAHARAVVAALKAAEGGGAAQVGGMMVDKPHLTQALQILQAAGEAGSDPA